MNRLTFLLTAVLLTILIGFLLAQTAWKKNQPFPSKKRISVTTSFYPLYFFANEIGGEKTEVKNITPAGSEPHDYEPSTQDIAHIEKSDLLILNGQLEGWGDKIKNELGGKKVLIVTAAEGLITQKDPHVWLDPLLAQKEAEVITQALGNIDPQNKSYYEQNAKRLEEKLHALDDVFRNTLRNCKQQNIVTSHAAFGYIASAYNLKQISISGLSPDEEPSPQKLAEISRLVKANNIKYIFFETLVSPRLAQTIAQETGAKTLAFNPLEGLTKEDQEKGKDYFSIQKENGENLKIALECP